MLRNKGKNFAEVGQLLVLIALVIAFQVPQIGPWALQLHVVH